MFKKSSVILLSILILMAFTNVFGQKATYTGAKKCKPCHMKDGTAKVWDKTKHATAYKSLVAEKAQDKKECLKCHVVDVENKAAYEDGIGCEECHGAGSNYAKMDVMKDLAKAKAAGLTMPKGDEKLCKKCHTKEGNTHYKDFDYKKHWEQIAHPAKKG